jgi:hypothetical protein
MVLTVAVAVAALTAFAPVASAYVYWTDNGPGLSSTGTTIGRANLDGSQALPLTGPTVSVDEHSFSLELLPPSA